MFENIKTDIIYFKSNTDFELEFNLCGCCKMRLLTTKTSDKKTFVHSLARAVSRSQVVMVIGSLFSENGIINLTANAIGSSLTTVNNSEYGIESDQDIEIIKNSLPLVTPEGYFGGCIIESGPQTIILLSESKSIRKTIMSDLIHPYFQELSSYSEETQVEQDEEEAETEIQEEILEEAETEIQEEILEETVVKEENTEQTEEETTEEVTEDTVEVPTEKPVLELTENREKTAEGEKAEDVVEETNEIEDSGDFFFFGGTATPSDAIPQEFSPIPTAYTSYSPRKTGLFGMFAEKEEETFTFDDKDPIEEIENTHHDIDDIDDIDDIIDNFEPKQDARPFFPKKKSGLKISMLILMIVVLLAIAVLCYSLFYVPAQSGATAADNIQEIMNALLG